MVLLSVTGLIRTLLIIVGVFFLLRFLGKVMVAKRNLDEHEKLKRTQRAKEETIANAQKNFGKTSISKIGKSQENEGDFVDFEEINED